MEPTRIEILEQTIQSTPGNTFARYALALELSRAGQHERAWQQFERLLTEQPDYAATYLQAGMYLAKQGRNAEAREVFAKGIEVNRKQGNMHAQSELEAALEDLAAQG